MIKILNLLLVSSLSLCTIQAIAEVSADLVNKYHWGSFDFDGVKVKSTMGTTVNFDNAKKQVEGKLSKDNTYHMTWGHEEIENTQVLTVTEARLSLAGENTSVYSRTSTFSTDKLRSSTLCFGNAQKSALSSMKTTMKCVTATKRSCKRLMDAYGQEANKNALLKGPQQTTKAAQECVSVLKSYETMAKAFGNQSPQVEARHNSVINSDTARVKAFVDQSTGSKVWDPSNIGSLTKSGELDEMARGYASSIEGMQALTAALQVCADAQADLQDEGGSSSKVVAPAKENGKAQ